MADPDIYTVGGTVQAGSGVYIPRKADDELLALCRTGTFAYILAPRQVGKSSLMVRTAERLADEGTQSAIIDLTQIGVQVSAEAWYLGLLATIEDQLALGTNVVSWWQERAHLGLTQRLTRFFQEVLLAEVAAPVVIFVDEIDTTLSLAFTDDFYAAIRSLYDARARIPELRRLTFILIGVATPGDLIRDPQRTPFNIGQRVELTDFTFEEALPLAEGLGLPETAARQVLGWVLGWTSGHPYLTQRLCRVITEQARGEWSRADVDRLVASTFFGPMSEQDNNLQFVRDMLTRRSPDPAAVLETYREIRLGRRPVPDEEQSLVKSHLKLSGVVRREGTLLRVRNPIYRDVFGERWIREHLPPTYWTVRLRRAGRLIAILAFALLAVGALAVYALYQQSQAREQANTATTAQAQARGAQDTAEVRLQQVETANARSQTQQAEAEAQRAVAETQRARAEAQALAFRSQTVDDPELSLLLAAEAAQRIRDKGIDDPGGQIESVLRQALQASHVRMTLRGHTGKVLDATFSPDGAAILTAGEDDTARLWDARTGQPLMVLKGHTGPVTNAAFSPDGKLALTVSRTWYGSSSAAERWDGTARVWDVATGRQLALLGGSPGTHNIIAAAFSPDGALVVTAGADWLGEIWDARSGAHRAELRGHGYVLSSAAFSPDGKLVVTAGGDRTARVWDAATGRQLALLQKNPNEAVNDAVFSSDGAFILTASGGQLARIWDARTYQAVAEVNGLLDPARGATLKSGGGRLITTSGDVAQVWEIGTGTQLAAELRGHAGSVTSASLGPGGRLAVTTSEDGTTRVWDTGTSQQLAELRGPVGAVNRAAFSPDERLIVTASDDGTVRVWDAGTSRPAGTLRGQYIGRSPDSRWVLTAGDDAALWIWDTDSGSQIAELRGQQPKVDVSDIVFSADGRLIATTDVSQTVRVWDTTGGGEPLASRVYTDAVGGPFISADDRRVLIVTGDQAGTAHVRDVLSGAQVAELRGHTATLFGAAFSPDGRLVGTASNDHTSRVWDLASGRQVATVCEGGGLGPAYSIAFSPDSRVAISRCADYRMHVRDIVAGAELGTLETDSDAFFSPDSKLTIVAGRDNTAQLQETRAGAQVILLRGHTARIYSTAFSPDGRLILTTSEDGTARVWDAIGKRSLVELRGHTNLVTSGAFSPNGAIVATAGADDTVRVWDVRSGKQLAELGQRTQDRNAVAFSPNGRFMLTVGWDKQARLYTCELCGSLDDLLALAQARATRQLSAEERQQFGLLPRPAGTPTATP